MRNYFKDLFTAFQTSRFNQGFLGFEDKLKPRNDFKIKL
jgi:hypothetical protein